MATSEERAVRAARPDDAGACAQIYATYVRDSTATFETEPPSETDLRKRIADATRTHAWLVLEHAGEVAGYAYGTEFMARAAYRWSCTVSVYLHPDRRGSGGGRLLYSALLARLEERGYRMAMAGVALPNEPSLRLHEAMGFEPVGTYRRVGWKHGGWRDVTWLQRALGAGDPLSPPIDLS